MSASSEQTSGVPAAMPGRVAGSTPYAWPFDGPLDREQVALVICGSGSEWARRTPIDRDATANLTRLRSVASAVGVAVVLVHNGDPFGRTVTLARHARPLVPNAGEHVVYAAGIDGFYGSDLDPWLHRRGRTHLLFAGLGLETTVHSTLRRANDRGYECLTVADACLAAEPDCRKGAVSSIEMSGGIFGAVASTTAVIDTITHAQPEVPTA